MGALTGFATVGADYAAHSRSARGRLRHDLVAYRLLAELPAGPVRVLDVGCGDGEMTLRIAAAGHDVTATDPSAEMLGAAARRLAARPEVATGLAGCPHLPRSPRRLGPGPRRLRAGVGNGVGSLVP
ncbi:methyltransferase domain-containing protein [Streptomyces exfoliatus]|uniref:methyltransferase domain-containing protein n=1 Tax=Streptomyces exfoliatus TaxID=1905 RepID=UPI0004B772A0|nr:methyltransferase domain-containing protein [Streptomyces exfoliatus]